MQRFERIERRKLLKSKAIAAAFHSGRVRKFFPGFNASGNGRRGNNGPESTALIVRHMLENAGSQRAKGRAGGSRQRALRRPRNVTLASTRGSLPTTARTVETKGVQFSKHQRSPAS